MQEKKYTLKNLDCADCAFRIEEAVRRLPDVNSVSVNFATATMHLDAEDPEAVADTVKRIEPDVDMREQRQEVGTQEKTFRFGLKLLFIGISLALFALGLILGGPLHGRPPTLAEYLLFGSAYLLSGWRVLWAAGRSILKGRVFNEHFLMTVATLGAIAINALPEAVGVMLFFQVGEFFEDMAVTRSRRSIRSLLAIRPEYANRRQGDTYEKVAPEEVQVGDTILVKPGERVPLDGEVVSGRSLADTSTLTGESVPRSLEEGDDILAGMIVQSGSLVVRVTRSYSDSSISRILHLVESAVQKKAQTEKFITTFARYYTPAVVAAAAGVALLPPLLLPGATFQQWIYRALVILVISCPCALVISIPLGYFGGIGGAARRGILIKGSSYIDVLTRVGTVVFDKTGTLTRGVFRVSAVNALNGYSEDEILELAAVSESHSNHPIAEAIRSAYGRPIDPAAVSSYQEIAGQGISATVHGREIYVGNNRLLHQENIEHDVCDLELTVAHVVIDGSYAGYIVISDEEKPDAAQAVAELKRLGVGETVMLTGDVEQVARYTGRRLGIDTVYAGLLPEDKVRVLDEIGGQGVRGDRDGRGRNGRGKHGRGRGRSVSDGRFRNGRGKNSRVAFAGDGINDAPVIARADVGIAMGGYGSDAAIETADVVLMTDAPSKVPEAIRLSRRTRRIVMQNIAFALGVKLVFVALGAMGVASMWEAVFADMGVTLLAVFNALRVIR